MNLSLNMRGLRFSGGVLLASLAGAPAYAQTLGLAHGPEVPWWRVVGALLFCCLLGGLGALALKYRIRKQGGQRRVFDAGNWQRLITNFKLSTRSEDDSVARLRLIQTVHLSYQVDVCLLECDGETVMIATSPNGAFVVNRDAPTKTGASS